MLSTVFAYAQDYADKSRYLIDSLELSVLDSVKRIQLDSLLDIYHSTSNDTAQLRALSDIVFHTTHTNTRIRYNRFFKRQIDLLPGNVDYAKFKKACLSSYHGAEASIAGQLGRTAQQFSHYEKAIDIRRRMRDTVPLIALLSNVGIAYFSHAEYDKALPFFEESAELASAINSASQASIEYNNLAAISYKMGNKEDAHEYLALAEKEAKKSGDEDALINVVYRKGNFAEAEKDFDNALVAYQKCADYYIKIGDQPLTARMYMAIAWILTDKGESKEAMVMAEKGLKISNEYDLLQTKRNCLDLLQDNAKQQGDYKTALRYFKQLQRVKSKLKNQDNQVALIQKEADLRLQKELFRDSLANAHHLALEVSRNKRKTTFLWFSLIGLGLAILFSFILYQRYKVIQRQKREIAEERQKVQEANEELARLNETRSRFFTNISHEFRTPLTVIESSAEELRGRAESNIDHEVNVIQRNSRRLFALVNQILDLKKLESGNLEADNVQSDIAAYGQYLFQLLESMAQAKQIKCFYTTSPSEIVTDVDPDKFSRIFYNLYSNAVKYSNENGSLDVSITKAKDQIILVFEDDGVGISEKDLPHIFDRFYRVPVESNELISGSGIGLAIVKELVDAIGGQIQVYSKPGKGSKFTVCIPATNEATIVSIDNLKSTYGGVETSSQQSVKPRHPVEGNKPMILVVEDHPDLQEILVKKLEDSYDVLVASDGQVGLELAQKQIPDIILSDVMMPMMNGFDLCSAIRADERVSHIPFILLTAKADHESRIQGLEVGADAYLSKPFDDAELRLQLSNALKLTRRIQQRYAIESSPELPRESETDLRPERVKIEDEFINKIRTVLLDHLDDETFGIQELSKELGYSRSTLHRKIKSLTGVSTSIYIRNCRLAEAKKLLTSGKDIRVNEVAMAVGFNSLSYFSQQYKNLFGVSPSEA